MRKIVTIRGINHRSGTSAKTGKDYDFTEVHFTYRDDYVQGEKCASATIDKSALAFPLSVDDCAEFVFHFSNGRCFVDAVL